MTDSTPMSNIYIVIFLSTILPVEQTRELINELPSNFNFLHRRGLINLVLPNSNPISNNDAASSIQLTSLVNESQFYQVIQQIATTHINK